MKFKTFDEIIDGMNVLKHHEPFELIPGIIKVPKPLLPNFQKLFRPPGVTKNTGNGEVAMYWLLNRKYGGHYTVEKQSQNDVADFLVNDFPVEIKAWDQSLYEHKRIKIGRFEQYHDIRRLINIIFGAYNVFYAGRDGEKYGKRSYLSESSFGMNGLTRAFRCALQIKDVNFSHFDNLRDIFELPLFEELTDPADFAAKTFAALAKEKLIKKVGPGNFIVNVRPDNIGIIEVLKLGDLENVDLDLIKDDGARVQCAELFLNLLAFKES